MPYTATFTFNSCRFIGGQALSKGALGVGGAIRMVNRDEVSKSFPDNLLLTLNNCTLRDNYGKREKYR